MAFATSTVLGTVRWGKCTHGSVEKRKGSGPARTSAWRRARAVPPCASIAESGSRVRDVSGDELDAMIQASARPILLDAYAGM